MEKITNSNLGLANTNVLSPLAKGYMAMTLVLLIWSGFSLTVRAIGASPLTIADVALIRFSVPLIVLAPLLSKHLVAIKNARVSDVLLILLGGIPFLFLASMGAKSAPAAYVGTILAGTSPFFVALLSFVFYRQKITKIRTLALSLILLGVLAMIGGRSGAISTDMLKGICYLFGASIIWACYTLGLRRVGLNSITIAILLTYISFFIMLILMLTGVVATNWGSFTLQQALPFVIVQGLGVGILATIGFSYAVSKLGSARSSIMGSISPGLTALLAVPIFHEPLSIAILCGISLTITGVILSSRY